MDDVKTRDLKAHSDEKQMTKPFTLGQKQARLVPTPENRMRYRLKI